MKSNSKSSIFALQQKLSRPGITVVLAIFMFMYLLYLVILLTINLQKGGFALQTPETEKIVGYDNSVYEVDYSFNEVYPFSYYFKSYKYNKRDDGISNLTNSTTPYLIRSETVFLASLATLVIVLTHAHTKANNGYETIERIPLSKQSIKTIQWLSDFVSTLGVWMAHLAVIYVFYVIYMLFSPDHLIHTQSLYKLFVSERYLYMLFPVISLTALLRMLPLLLAISLLPSIISDIFFQKQNASTDEDTKNLPLGGLIFTLFIIALIYWGYFSSHQDLSVFISVLVMFLNLAYFTSAFTEGEHTDADKTT